MFSVMWSSRSWRKKASAGLSTFLTFRGTHDRRVTWRSTGVFSFDFCSNSLGLDLACRHTRADRDLFFERPADHGDFSVAGVCVEGECVDSSAASGVIQGPLQRVDQNHPGL